MLGPLNKWKGPLSCWIFNASKFFMKNLFLETGVTWNAGTRRCPPWLVSWSKVYLYVVLWRYGMTLAPSTAWCVGGGEGVAGRGCWCGDRAWCMRYFRLFVDVPPEFATDSRALSLSPSRREQRDIACNVIETLYRRDEWSSKLLFSWIS